MAKVPWQCRKFYVHIVQYKAKVLRSECWMEHKSPYLHSKFVSVCSFIQQGDLCVTTQGCITEMRVHKLIHASQTKNTYTIIYIHT